MGFASHSDVKEAGLEVAPLFRQPGAYLWQVVWGGEVIHEQPGAVALADGGRSET